MPAATKPNALPVSASPTSVCISSGPACVVEEREGGAVVHFRVSPEEWSRMKRKMHVQSPDRFVWENILKPAISSAVF